MARSRRRRSPVRRRKGSRGRMAPKGRFPTAAIIVGAGAAGVAALLLWRSSSEAAATSSTTQTTGELPPGVTATTPRSSGTQNFNLNGPSIPNAVAQRIDSSESARQAFAVQALLYEAGQSNQAPDALTSTVNSQLASLSARTHGAVGPIMNPSSLAEVRQYIFGQNPGITLRFLPWVMAQAQIDAVNLSAAQMDSQFIYLQAQAASISSAGMPLAPAG